VTCGSSHRSATAQRCTYVPRAGYPPGNGGPGRAAPPVPQPTAPSRPRTRALPAPASAQAPAPARTPRAAVTAAGTESMSLAQTTVPVARVPHDPVRPPAEQAPESWQQTGTETGNLRERSVRLAGRQGPPWRAPDPSGARSLGENREGRQRQAAGAGRRLGSPRTAGSPKADRPWRRLGQEKNLTRYAKGKVARVRECAEHNAPPRVYIVAGPPDVVVHRDTVLPGPGHDACRPTAAAGDSARTKCSGLWAATHQHRRPAPMIRSCSARHGQPRR
jgi:hypothetical protein